jgi:hypothetical protein
MTEHAGPAARMSERYKSRTREPAARGPTAGQEQEKTEKLRAMIQILEDKLAKVSVHLLKRIILYCLLKNTLMTTRSTTQTSIFLPSINNLFILF